MSEIKNGIIEAYIAAREEITKEEQSIKTDDPNTVAALLVLANEISGAKEELKRIAQVLGAEELAKAKIAQSDVPDNMLALLTALRGTTEPIIPS